jgi:ABC-type transport system involved in cytochrome c biogenesis permease subunit
VGAVPVLLIVALVGFAPAATIWLKRTRTRYLLAVAWLAVAAVFSLRPAANYPHPFGMIFFVAFFVGWIVALALIYSRSGNSRNSENN